jgi:hypothetical protein
MADRRSVGKEAAFDEMIGTDCEGDGIHRKISRETSFLQERLQARKDWGIETGDERIMP